MKEEKQAVTLHQASVLHRLGFCLETEYCYAIPWDEFEHKLLKIKHINNHDECGLNVKFSAPTVKEAREWVYNSIKRINLNIYCEISRQKDLFDFLENKEVHE
jgi:hypothetical protein